jgi:hypothetical protein
MFPVRYELGFYNPEDGILHSHSLEDLKPYMGTVHKRSEFEMFISDKHRRMGARGSVRC